MTSLKRPTLGTDPNRGWMFYSIHLAMSYVLKEYFLASLYRKTLRCVEGTSGELRDWSLKMRADDYHELHTHAFVGMWAAFEAGVEDTIAAFLANDRTSAGNAISKFRSGRYSIDDWPWPRSKCVEVAKRLDQRGKDATNNGGIDLFARIRTIFAWLDVHVPENAALSAGMAEASKIRNVTLHRYGELDATDVNDIPDLTPWAGKVMPITNAKFDQYYRSISGCLTSLMSAVAASRHAAT